MGECYSRLEVCWALGSHCRFSYVMTYCFASYKTDTKTACPLIYYYTRAGTSWYVRIVVNRKHASTYLPVAFRKVHTGIEPPFFL